jgi:hypothetical protein
LEREAGRSTGYHSNNEVEVRKKDGGKYNQTRDEPELEWAGEIGEAANK